MKNDEATMGMGMGMMSGMMQNMMKGMGGDMPEMCMKMMEQMTGSMNESVQATSYATPEMCGLFEDWMQNLAEEVVAFVREKGRATPSDIAKKLKISEESTLFLVGKLAREGKLVIGEIGVPA